MEEFLYLVACLQPTMDRRQGMGMTWVFDSGSDLTWAGIWLEDQIYWEEFLSFNNMINCFVYFGIHDVCVKVL